MCGSCPASPGRPGPGALAHALISRLHHCHSAGSWQTQSRPTCQALGDCPRREELCTARDWGASGAEPAPPGLSLASAASLSQLPWKGPCPPCWGSRRGKGDGGAHLPRCLCLRPVLRTASPPSWHCPASTSLKLSVQKGSPKAVGETVFGTVGQDWQECVCV